MSLLMRRSAFGHSGLLRRALGSLLVLTIGCDGCVGQARVGRVAKMPYPLCGKSKVEKGKLLARGHLRSGPLMRDQSVVERFELRQRSCLYAMTVRQEWPMGIADVEALYDLKWRPMRVWKRMTLPANSRGRAADNKAGSKGQFDDTRLYQVSPDRVTLIHRDPEGEMHYRVLKGPRPLAVVGPGRGLLVPWLRKANLEVGEKDRVPVLDFRHLAKIKTVALKREEDRAMEVYGGKIRVYTVFGREAVFANRKDVVVGDLAGLRPDATLGTSRPRALSSYAEPDPVSTP